MTSFINLFVFNTMPQVVFRLGAAAEMGTLAGAKCGSRALFVTDPGLRALGLCDPALTSLADNGISVTVFIASRLIPP